MPVETPATPSSVMNRDTALARMGGDERLLTQMAEFFLADAPALMRELHTALQKGDARAAHHAAHSLKGLSANFEALSAIAAAREIELLSKAGDTAGCASLIGRLDEEISRLTVALQTMLSE